MKIFIEKSIIKTFAQEPQAIKAKILDLGLNHEWVFSWPSLLEYLDLGSLLSTLPLFDQTHALFNQCISILSLNEEKEAIFYLFDSLFVENLTQIKNLSQVDSAFFLQAIALKRQSEPFFNAEKELSSALEPYETALTVNPSHLMHDLILYLAWERICVWIGSLFDYQSSDQKFINNLQILKECLIESFQHITSQGRTSPSFYRLLEALFFYQVREENFQIHSQADWNILSQSFPVLLPPNCLADVRYVDNALVPLNKLNQQENSEWYLTLDSQDKIDSRLKLANYMCNQLKTENPQWNYQLVQKQIQIWSS